MTAAKDPKDQLPLTIDAIMTALKAKNGNVLKASKLLGRNKGQVYYHLQRSEELREYLDRIRFEKDEDLLDEAEEKLAGRVKKNDWRAVQYTLDRKGHKRGYTPSSQSDEDITVHVVRDDD